MTNRDLTSLMFITQFNSQIKLSAYNFLKPSHEIETLTFNQLIHIGLIRNFKNISYARHNTEILPAEQTQFEEQINDKNGFPREGWASRSVPSLIDERKLINYHEEVI